MRHALSRTPNPTDDVAATSWLQERHLDCADLARRHRTTVAHIHKLRSQAPHRLPPPLDLGGKRLIWRLVDVEAWESARVAGAIPKRMGRESTAAKARRATADGQGLDPSSN